MVALITSRWATLLTGSGSTARQLAAVPSSADPSRTTVAYIDGTAGNIGSEKLLKYRVAGRHSDIPFSDLDQTHTLGQLALAFAEAFNTTQSRI